MGKGSSKRQPQVDVAGGRRARRASLLRLKEAQPALQRPEGMGLSVGQDEADGAHVPGRVAVADTIGDADLADDPAALRVIEARHLDAESVAS